MHLALLCPRHSAPRRQCFQKKHRKERVADTRRRGKGANIPAELEAGPCVPAQFRVAVRPQERLRTASTLAPESFRKRRRLFPRTSLPEGRGHRARRLELLPAPGGPGYLTFLRPRHARDVTPATPAGGGGHRCRQAARPQSRATAQPWSPREGPPGLCAARMRGACRRVSVGCESRAARPLSCASRDCTDSPSAQVLFSFNPYSSPTRSVSQMRSKLLSQCHVAGRYWRDSDRTRHEAGP